MVLKDLLFVKPQEWVKPEKTAKKFSTKYIG
jgi:hypothetical protein